MITVGIVTYNSEKFIIELLHSLEIQSYDLSKINLVISDDGSKDNTLSLVDIWINEHCHEFLSVKFIKSNVNEGTVINCGKVLNVCETKWLKLIAGDDVLLVDALFVFCNYINTKKDSWDPAIISSKMHVIGSANKVKPDARTVAIVRSSSERKNIYRLRLQFGTIAPAVLINADILKAVGGFKSGYTLLEDLPTWDLLLAKGFYFDFLDEFTTGYRVHPGQTVGKKLNPKLALDLRRYALEIYNAGGILNRIIGLHRLYILMLSELESRVGRGGIFFSFLRLLNPMYLYTRLLS